MNKISGTRKLYSATTPASTLDIASSFNSTYLIYTDEEFLTSGALNVKDFIPYPVGDSISKRTTSSGYLNQLINYRKENYQSKWYESGWFKNFRESGTRYKFAKTFYRLNEDPYSTVNGQAYCLDRVLTANFSEGGGYPYGFPDEYPKDITSGTKFKICGYIDNDPYFPPFISPYKNIYELVDHSGVQQGYMGRNYWTKDELLNFGLYEGFANVKNAGIKSGIATGQEITYNKLYFQDNIPNLDWCLTNNCSFLYANIRGARNLSIDNPYFYGQNTVVKNRIFVFSGNLNFVPSGTSPEIFDLGYGPYFELGNTGLFAKNLYNQLTGIDLSGSILDTTSKHIHIINTGDLPKNFYLSSTNTGFLQIVDDTYKTSNFYYPNNSSRSGELVQYYTVGKNKSIPVRYLMDFNTGSYTSSFNAPIINNTYYVSTGAIILHEVTGTILDNGVLSFLTKQKYIRAKMSAEDNKTRFLVDDFYFSAGKNFNVTTIARTGNSISFDLSGRLLVQTSGIATGNIFALTVYSTGQNVENQRNSLIARYNSGIRSIPDKDARASIRVSTEDGDIIRILNTEQQYLKYESGYQGLFLGSGTSNWIPVSKKSGTNFDPYTGAVQLDLLFRINSGNLPVFDLSNNKQEYYIIKSGLGSYVYENAQAFPIGAPNPSYKVYSSGLITGIYLKRGYQYNLLQVNNTDTFPLAVRGDISGSRVIEPNYNKNITKNYRLLQFTVDEKANDVNWFSVRANPVTGVFQLTGQNLDRNFNNIIGIKISTPNQIPQDQRVARTGMKIVYYINNSFAPEIKLDKNARYTFDVWTGYTGFYLYTGSSIYGSGFNEYSGSNIAKIPLSGLLVNSVSPYEVTGYAKETFNRYVINTTGLNNNLYYGDKYSAYAGNKLSIIDENQTINRFSNYVTPIFTGIISIQTNDITEPSIRINYNLMQNSGSIPIV
jgi:hypothetical protein